MSDFKAMNIVALSGGVGGAKLALGLSKVLAAQSLSVITNTADDFEHLNLPISPDLDTVMYTLAGLNNTELGWGLAGESWQFMQALQQLNGETWFQLGDKDLATHLQRAQLLKTLGLTEVTQQLSQQLNVEVALLPMCNERVSTYVTLAEDFTDVDRAITFNAGQRMGFQEYFVRYQCEPVISAYEFDGLPGSQLTPQASAAVAQAQALIVCPSNPFVSIEPILAVNGMRKALLDIATRVVVSPIVAGLAIKGPAAKMMAELAMPVTALAVAKLYQGFATHFVLDSADLQYQSAIENLGMKVLVCNTIMKTEADKKALAAFILQNI